MTKYFLYILTLVVFPLCDLLTTKAQEHACVYKYNFYTRVREHRVTSWQLTYENSVCCVFSFYPKLSIVLLNQLYCATDRYRKRHKSLFCGEEGKQSPVQWLPGIKVCKDLCCSLVSSCLCFHSHLILHAEPRLILYQKKIHVCVVVWEMFYPVSFGCSCYRTDVIHSFVLF